MAIFKSGTITSTGAAINLALGFVPDYIEIFNDTKIASGTGVGQSYWLSSMANSSAYISTLTGGAPVITKITTNGFLPYQTADSSLWTSTNRTITGLSQAAAAQVTSTAHGFTSADVGVTVVTFSGVVGMVQINTLRGVIQSIVDANNFTVNINSTSFTAYSSGGIANVITGIPPSTTYPVNGPMMTPQSNVGTVGITLGTSVAGSASDVLRYVAWLNTPVTS